jgi:hypothetical protein
LREDVPGRGDQKGTPQLTHSGMWRNFNLFNIILKLLKKKNKNKEYVPEATTNIAHVCPFRGTL